MKDTFFKSTVLLLIGGIITKILGMVIKIIMTRIAGVDAISLYMLIFPTFILFLTLSQLGLPTALSKIVAEDKHNNKNLIISIIPISIIYNLVLIIIIILSSKLITSFLNDERVFYPIIAIAFVIPFDSLSNILRGYFFGKQRILPHIISLITEQITRLALILLVVPYLKEVGIVETVFFLIIVNLFSELLSIIVLLCFIKNKKIDKKDFKINKNEVRNIFDIAVPTTISRLIGSISYFLEPIIITISLINQGYLKEYIVLEYGVIEGFVLPLILIPSFLTNALSSALIPDIAKKYVIGDIWGIKRRIKKVIKITLLIGIIYGLIIYINPEYYLNLLYGINNGVNYLKVLIPFFILLYIEYPLESILQAINKSKSIMINNLIGTSIKLLSIFIFSYLRIGLYNLIIGIILGIIVTTLLHFRIIKKELLNK